MRTHHVRLLAVLLLSTVAFAQTDLRVRINNRLSSENTPAGTRFDGTLMDSTTLGGRSCNRGSRVDGHVSESLSSGRLKNPGVLELQIDSVNCSGRIYRVNAAPIRLEGRSHTKRNVALIGGGAAAGAVLGGIAGGTKGAVIGGAIGAGAGTATAAATGRKEAVVEPEAIVVWRTAAVSSGALSRASGGERYGDSYNERDRRDNDRDRDRDRDDDNYYGRNGGRRNPGIFTDEDQRIIRGCFNGRSGLPPGLAKKDRLPPGLEKQLRRNGTLPPGLAKKARPLPGECVARLPRLPGGWERIILGDRVILLDPQRTILDLFYLIGR